MMMMTTRIAVIPILLLMTIYDADASSLSSKVAAAWAKRRNTINSNFAVTARALSVLPEVREDVSKRLNDTHRQQSDRIISKLHAQPLHHLAGGITLAPSSVAGWGRISVSGPHPLQALCTYHYFSLGFKEQWHKIGGWCRAQDLGRGHRWADPPP